MKATPTPNASVLPWEVFPRTFREGGGTPAEILQAAALVALAILLFFALLFCVGIVQRRRSQPVARQPYRLFRRMISGLNLPVFDRILLLLVARSSGLSQPTIILLSPALLEQFGREWAGRVVLDPLRQLAWGRLSDVSRRVHGQPLPAIMQ